MIEGAIIILIRTRLTEIIYYCNWCSPSQHLLNWNTPRPKSLIVELQYNRLDHIMC